MVREVITYPHKLLRVKSEDVVKFDEELHTLLDDMYETMINQTGVGLAAIQVAIPLNILIICLPDEEDVQNKDNLIEAINPVVTHKDGEQVFTEGCLSVPGFTEDVTRAQHIVVEYFNRNGEKQTMEAEDFLAVAWQHEMEHLAGHLFIEHLSFLKRKKFEKEWKKRLKEQKK
ncbi:peptide deformylase [Poseidonibacter ostreae]|jgi:peptide deformylase|uniref:Peptide deformylase n=1 Tax=Poseidonibacter ostreae TaxID=2654171 RepID=A0ABQ6VLR7_9BACT|nr:peptide deformylase [Poseidonibacter ostreae]KAB7886435.1 peptide deformylase [Poseidonibacter ostreae]KAB7891537.1 peptide deformylase [Poseidonibacter ostreae]MAC84468.1 peptide deformylase [Arcobacter sp.]|tara:strand:- start:4496 stop:5014 length:519 start_codon:yes stop_codon:yes gene_type:complete